MRWILTMLAVGAACSSAQHTHTAPKRRAEPAQSGWEGGVSEPRRMDDLSEVAPVEPLSCEVYFKGEDREKWFMEYIECVADLGEDNPKCLCMEPFQRDDWED